MNRFRLVVILIALAAGLGGCASYPDLDQERLESLPQSYAQFDAVLSWQVRNLGSRTLIEGEFKNVRYALMDGIEVWVAAFDASGKVTARSVSFIVPRQLRGDEVAPFSLVLPVGAAPGTRLRFTYRYTASDGGSGGGAGGQNWMQSFETVVPGP